MDKTSLENDPVFELFSKHWALVSTGTIEKHNACTVSWGSFGILWERPGKSGKTITVYLHPSRYTCEMLKERDTFTVSFFEKEYQKALGYMGSHTGRNEDKAKAAGLTPVELPEGGLGFKEAKVSFVCRKIYQHMFTKEDLAPDIQEYYKGRLQAFPLNEKGEWEPHIVFVGEIKTVTGNE